MKRGICFILFTLLIAGVIAVHAQELPDSGIPPEIEKITTLGQNATNAVSQFQSQNSSYLKQEWKKIIMKNAYIGPVLTFIFKYLDPVSKLLIKQEIDFTWVYFFALSLWITLIIIVYSPMKAFFNMHWALAILAGIIVASLIVRQIPTTWLEFQISLIWKIVLIFVLLLIIFGVIIFSDYLKAAIKKEKERTREEKEGVAEDIHDQQIRAIKR